MASEAGLDFVHFNGMSGELYFPEMTGQGAGLLDYDGDGDLDVYLVQGALLGPGKTLDDALFPPQRLPLVDRLYRNDLTLETDGSRQLRFVDITAAAGLEAGGYGMGVATGDFDNDGWVDLYVTNYGPNQMFRNRGDGTFTDVTTAAGTDDPRWSTSAAFLDFDRDGWLDLYVVNYVDFAVDENPTCYAPSSRRDYCGPADFEPLPDTLFRNRGDGTFENVSLASGIARRAGAGLGVVAADLDGDAWLDIYVANDGMANDLWINRGDGNFDNEALLAGVAVNREGRAEASMGVDAGDFDGDGDDDLFMTHLMGESNTLYVNDGSGLFQDRSIETRLAAGSLPYTSFGTAWLDFDNDGWLDLLILNGAVRILEPLARAGDPYPLHQPNQLLLNVAGQRFEEASERAGPVFRLSEVSRGAAVGDVDNDGDADVLLINNSGPARLLLNLIGEERPWLGGRALAASGRDLLGARLAVLRPEAPALWRRIGTDGSYCSAGDPRALAGLGSSAEASAIRVRWPDGSETEWRKPPAGRYLTLTRSPAGRQAD